MEPFTASGLYGFREANLLAISLTSFHLRIRKPSLPGMFSGPPFSELTIARESVSQNRYVPSLSETHASIIASNKRPAEVMKEAKGAKNHFPSFSMTSDASEKFFSPENA